VVVIEVMVVTSVVEKVAATGVSEVVVRHSAVAVVEIEVTEEVVLHAAMVASVDKLLAVFE